MRRITLNDIPAEHLGDWRATETHKGLAEADAGEFATDPEVEAVRARWSEVIAE